MHLHNTVVERIQATVVAVNQKKQSPHVSNLRTLAARESMKISKGP